MRGHSVISRYFKADESANIDGWFPTGDLATIDCDGSLRIRDRLKDLIKTGGEWISSSDLENIAMTHPAVAMAAVIGVRHPHWQERPLLLATLKPGQFVSKTDLLRLYAGSLPKWAVPDEVIFVASLPLGGTGKVQKANLRETYSRIFATLGGSNF